MTIHKVAWNRTYFAGLYNPVYQQTRSPSAGLARWSSWMTRLFSCWTSPSAQSWWCGWTRPRSSWCWAGCQTSSSASMCKLVPVGRKIYLIGSEHDDDQRGHGSQGWRVPGVLVDGPADGAWLPGPMKGHDHLKDNRIINLYMPFYLGCFVANKEYVIFWLNLPMWFITLCVFFWLYMTSVLSWLYFDFDCNKGKFSVYCHRWHICLWSMNVALFHSHWKWTSIIISDHRR